jgi:predicted O-methyltransferase YrrM
MLTDVFQVQAPAAWSKINDDTQRTGFNMSSDLLTGSMLKTLAASKPNGRFLELGTGSGLSTSWLVDGMDATSRLISVDHDAGMLAIAEAYLGHDERLQLVLEDAGSWITMHAGERFDLIFADTWHGKYLMLEEALEMVNPGGYYVIDDMLPQPNWPEGHAEKAESLILRLLHRLDFTFTPLDWSTGLFIGVKK